jgi:hypothetical protein
VELTVLSLLLAALVGALFARVMPLFFGRFRRGRKLPPLPRQIVADIEGQTPIRVRQWRYVESIYLLMSEEEINFLGDLYHRQQEFGLYPTQREVAQARAIINDTVLVWLMTETGQQWRRDNRR